VRPLYKTTVVIWTDYDASGVSLQDLAFDAEEGNGYGLRSDSAKVDIPESELDKDGLEFFNYPTAEEQIQAEPCTCEVCA
jgi:hypothetical protein